MIKAIDKETIDGVLERLAEAFTWLGEAFKRFNTVVIDGVVDGLVYATRRVRAAGSARRRPAASSSICWS